MKNPLGTYRRYLEETIRTRVFRSRFGRRWLMSLGITYDSVAQALIDAWRVFLQQRGGGPAYDALDLLGRETQIPQMSSEGWTSYRDRLRDPWETWDTAGTEFCLEDQLTRSVFTDAQIFPYGGNGSDSEFIVFLPEGSHPVTGPGPAIGTFTVGDGTFIGPEGLDPKDLQSIRVMVERWKPATWKCPWVIFEISGWTIGTGHIIGEPGLVIGGEQAKVRVQ